MVFQFYALYPHLTVRDNIAFPLRAAAVPAPERRRRVDSVAERMALTHLLGCHPRQLSGGDQQKVSLARWSRTFSALVSAGVPLLQALDITGKTSG